MARMPIRAVIFDLDDTLISTRKLEPYRKNSMHSELVDNINKARLFPQIKAILTGLQQKGIKIGLVTNSPRLYTDTLLKHFGIFEFFDSTICYDEAAPDIKPSPRGILRVLNELGVEPHQGVYVGDLDSDFEAAYHARLIPVAPSWATRNPISVAPSAIINSEQLLSDLDNINRIQYLAEIASKYEHFTPKTGAMYYFIPLNDKAQIVPLKRQEITHIALGRYFSLRSPLSATLHSEQNLSKHIYSKEELPLFEAPDYWIELFSFAIDKLPKWLFGGESTFDIVAVIPSKPEKNQRLEQLLERIAASYSHGPTFIGDLFYFNKGSKSLKTLGNKENRVQELSINLHFNEKYTHIAREKKILLIDDVITTGATLARANELLQRYCNTQAIGCCLAKTVRTSNDYVPCPLCARPMQVRRNGKTGISFYGCSGFHEPTPCKHTLQIFIKECPHCDNMLCKHFYKERYFYGHDFKSQGKICTYIEDIENND
jgi:phosphoglycolate phosphatase-like HAD superfamily hydrolase